MTAVIIVVVAISLLLIVVGFVLGKRATSSSPPKQIELIKPQRSGAGTDIAGTGLESTAQGQVVIQMTGDHTALIFGEESDVAAIGRPISTLPGKVANGLVAGNAALQTVVAAGSASGHLVRLSDASVAALNAMGPVKDASGAMLGVVRDSQGHFAHVIRFTSVDKVAALASLGPALTSIALQMQLQQLSDQLEQVQKTVGRIEQKADDELAASVEANLAAAMRDYRMLQRTGAISETGWALIAGRQASVETDVRRLAKQMERITQGVNDLRRNGTSDRPAKQRHEALREILEIEKPIETFDLYMRAQQSVLLSEVLRLHRLVTTDDPHLELHRAESQARARAAIGDMRSACDALDAAMLEAKSGELTSYLFWRNNWTDQPKKLEAQVDDLRSRVEPVFQLVRQQHLQMERGSKAINGHGSLELSGD